MPPATGIERLDAIPKDHPCLWGELEVRDAQEADLRSWNDVTVLPTHTRRGEPRWWRRGSYGVFDAAGRHVRTLSDMRGERHCCHPRPRLADNPFNSDRVERHDVVLYGGTLYAAFGHLVLDSGRAYQLLREHRQNDLPIWFHDATPHRHPGSILKLGLVQAWLKQLGLRKRARLIRRPLVARELISSGALYNDRGYASRALRPACAAALKPRLRNRLLALPPPQRRLVYLSRHKLQGGSTLYPQEAELVEQLAGMRHVDVICPEDLSFEEKLGLYRRYAVIAGFPQACMGLKLFVPGEQLARQVMFVSGPRSLSSTWINIDRAVGWGDAYVHCDAGLAPIVADDPSQPFQRTNPFDPQPVLQAIRHLTSS